MVYMNISVGYMELTFNDVTKSFGDLNVIEHFSTTIKTGEIVALVGPSGCGKSTLLHMLAGLEKPSTGTLTANGKGVENPHLIALWYFRSTLYTLADAGGKRGSGAGVSEHAKAGGVGRGPQMVGKVELSGFEHYYPHQVSGGMRQRCALARALSHGLKYCCSTNPSAHSMH